MMPSLGRADKDALDDYAADQALVAPIRQPSASHFSSILDSSPTHRSSSQSLRIHL